MPKNIQKNKKDNKINKKSKNTLKLENKLKKNNTNIDYEDTIHQIESLSETEILENEDESENLANLSIEDLLKKEFKNIIRICDICGNEMNLDIDFNNFEVFICNNCGYKIKINNEF